MSKSKILRQVRAFARGSRGAAAAEFGLIAPLLFLMLAGLMEFGIFMWNKHSFEFAIEESGRVVMAKSTVTEGDVAADVKSRLPTVDSTKLTLSVTKETVGQTTFVNIGASYSYSTLLIGFLGFETIQIDTGTRVPMRSP